MAEGLQLANGRRWENNHISPSKLDLWSKCSAAFWFRYVMRIRKPGKVWLPQGTAVHAGVEHLLNDLSAGIQRDKEYYELMAEVADQKEISSKQPASGLNADGNLASGAGSTVGYTEEFLKTKILAEAKEEAKS